MPDNISGWGWAILGSISTIILQIVYDFAIKKWVEKFLEKKSDTRRIKNEKERRKILDMVSEMEQDKTQITIHIWSFMVYSLVFLSFLIFAQFCFTIAVDTQTRVKLGTSTFSENYVITSTIIYTVLAILGYLAYLLGLLVLIKFLYPEGKYWLVYKHISRNKINSAKEQQIENKQIVEEKEISQG